MFVGLENGLFLFFAVKNVDIEKFFFFEKPLMFVMLGGNNSLIFNTCRCSNT